MDMFFIFLPEISVSLLAIVLILAKILLHKSGFRAYGWIATGWLALTALIMLANPGHDYTLSWNGLYFVDAYADYFKILLIAIAAIVSMASVSYVRQKDHHHAEFFILLTFALLGMIILAASGDLITLYIGLELMTLSFVLLIAYPKFDNLSTEAALKYLLLSALSSAVMLYGMSLVYGFTGTTIFAEMPATVGQALDQPLFILGLIFFLVGFAFKISAVPFHMWAPDIYQGAPTQVAGFMAVGSKAATLAIMARVLLNLFGDYTHVWVPILIALALMSFLLGNLVAIPQRDVKRMLAYSAIAQGGYLLLGIIAASIAGVYALIFYTTAYAIANLGAFIVAGNIEEETGSTHITAYVGMHRRAPFLAAAMFIFLISLAGLPPMAGFIGKFFLFTAAIDSGYLWLALIGLIMSMISVYYYFTVVRAMYFTPEADTETPNIPISGGKLVALIVCTILTIALGIFFQPLADAAMTAAETVLFM